MIASCRWRMFHGVIIMQDPGSPSHSAFTEILEAALRTSAGEDQPSASVNAPYRASDPQVQQAIDDLLSSPAFVPVGKLAQIYNEERAGQMPQELYRFLADELHLSPDLTVDQLRRLRREFAVSNHPDRVEPSERHRATRRMSLVNVLIDKALKEKTAGASSNRTSE
jgi:hypothetical protein